MRRALFIAIPVMLLLGAAFYFLSWTPVGEDIALQEQELAILQTEGQALTQRKISLERVNERLPEYDRANATMLLSIPTTPQVAALTDELSVLADQANVDWTQVSFGTPSEESDSGYREIGIALTIEGQYFEVLGYLYGLSELDRLVRVNSVDVSPTLDNDTGVNSLAVTINGTAFTTGEIVVPPTPEVADPDIPAATDEQDSGDGGFGDDGSTTTTSETSSTTTTTVGG